MPKLDSQLCRDCYGIGERDDNGQPSVCVGCEGSGHKLSAIVRAWGDARLAVAAAVTRQKFLEASADLWDAERVLSDAAALLRRRDAAAG